MTLLHTVLLGGIVVLGLKILGYSVPSRWFDGEKRARLLQLSTISLLAALTAVQAFAAGQSLELDARAPALGGSGGFAAGAGSVHCRGVRCRGRGSGLTTHRNYGLKPRRLVRRSPQSLNLKFSVRV